MTQIGPFKVVSDLYIGTAFVSQVKKGFRFETKGLRFETKGLRFEKRPPFEAHGLKFEITLGDISLVHYVNVE